MAFKIEYVYQAIDKFSTTGRKIASVVDSMSKKFEESGKKVQKLGKAINDAGKKGIAKLSASLAVFTGVSLKSAANIETLQTSFESLLGSAQAAKDTVAGLVDFTAKTPFQLDGVGKAAKQLLAFGVTQDELMPTLKQLGDIASGANIPLADMAQIFGKAKAKGKLMTEEILQMSERGIPIVDLLAKRFGVTKQAIFDAASKSQISFAMMQDALGTLTAEGGIFFDQMNKQSRTLAGITSTLRDNVSLAFAEVGNSLVEALDIKTLMSDFISTIQKATSYLKQLSPATKKFLAIALILGTVLAPVVVVIGSIISGFGSLLLVAGTLGISLSALTLPFLAIVAAIAAVIAIGVLVYKNWDKIKAKALEIKATLFAAFTWVFNKVKGIFASMSLYVSDKMTEIADFISEHNPFSGLVDSFHQTMDELSRLSVRDFIPSGLADFIGAAPKAPESIVRRPPSLAAQGAPMLAGAMSSMDINVNVRDRSGVIESVQSKTKAGSNTRLKTGVNMR